MDGVIRDLGEVREMGSGLCQGDHPRPGKQVGGRAARKSRCCSTRRRSRPPTPRKSLELVERPRVELRGRSAPVVVYAPRPPGTLVAEAATEG
jgi:hypothetical protein